MLNRDPPDHARLRRLVTKAFTPSRIDALRPRVADITAGLLDVMANAGPTVDLSTPRGCWPASVPPQPTTCCPR